MRDFMRNKVNAVAMPRASAPPAPGRDLLEAGALLIRPSRLEGEVKVSGAKNSALRLMVASLLTAEPVVLDNFPGRILDGVVQGEMLRLLGKQVSAEGDRLAITELSRPKSRLEWQGRSIRNTLLVLGALVARTGAGSVPLPGGCDLGGRGFDFHRMVLSAMGARVWVERGSLHAECLSGRLTGAEIRLPLRSTGATENALLCASLARGRTRIWNPHVRPEVLDLVATLRKMGAGIDVFGQESIVVEGADKLGGAHHRVLPDNIEAITWLIGAAITGGELRIHDFPAEDLEVALIFLRESGVNFTLEGSTLQVRAGRCYPVDISTGPYPGINSDMQPLFAAFAAMAQGESRIVDLRFPDRFGYVAELARLGVRASVTNSMLAIQGGAPLRGGEVRALDLRGGVALALLGLVAEGETRIADAWQIQRGYDDFVGKLASLQADVSIPG